MNTPLLIELREPDQVFQPSHDEILIQPFEAPGTTAGGLHLPTGSMSKSLFGKIVSLGRGNTCPLTGQTFPLEHHVGDVVVFRPLAQVYEVKFGGVSYYLGRDTDIAGRIAKVEAPAETAPPPAA